MSEARSPQFNIGIKKKNKDETDVFSWTERTMIPTAKPYKAATKLELDAKSLISSERWIQLHGLRRNRLQLQQILQRIGFKQSDDYIKSLKKPVGSYYGEGLFHRMKATKGTTYNITASKETLKDIECHLKETLNLMKRRQEWLTSGSRKIFGVIQEQCVCLVLNVSTMVQSQFDMFLEAICEILQDQISQLAKVNLIRAQNDMLEWCDQCMPVSDVTIEDAVHWVKQLDKMAEVSNTSCTEALIKALEDQSLEAIYLFNEGDVNESAKELLRQKLKECSIPIHTVSFNVTKPSTVSFLNSMASDTGGRFHAFTAKSDYEDEGDVMGKSAFLHSKSSVIPKKLLSQSIRGGLPHGAGVREDVFLLWHEMEKARNILADIQTLISNIEESTKFLGDSKAVPVSSEKPKENLSSKLWLQHNGINANHLTIFHALANFAFRHVDDVIELQKPNNSCEDMHQKLKLIEAKYCKNFPHVIWKDNQIVHVYVSAELFKHYERKMKYVLSKLQHRIDWLQQGSREVFGTILEEKVYFLIDSSSSMAQNLPTLKEQLLQLFQEQLRHKSEFNFVKFESKAFSWKPRLEEITEDSLSEAWHWIKGLEPGGSTNTLAALRVALADPNTEGIYLLTDGRPDQPANCVLSQVQLYKPVPIHTIAFNCNDLEANKFLHKMALDTGGRYHCYTTHGGICSGPPPFESEDVSLLKDELELGKEYLKRMSALRARCIELDWQFNKNSKRGKMQSLQDEHELKAQKDIEEYEKMKVPDTPSTRFGIKSQPLLLGISHEGHRGRFGVNDCDMHGIKMIEAPLSNTSANTSSEPKKKSRKPRKSTGVSNSVWLRKNNLKALRLTLIDALGSTVIQQRAKHIDIINKKVISKVFDDILPIAHVSPRNQKQILLLNPNSVNLVEYESKLEDILQTYRNRLNRQIWDHLSEVYQKKYGSRTMFLYITDPEDEQARTAPMEEIDSVMEQLGWPIPKYEIQVLLDEIKLGETYLKRSKELRMVAAQMNEKPAKKSTCKRKKKKRPLPLPTFSVSTSSESFSDSDFTKSNSISACSEEDIDYPYRMAYILRNLTGETVVARSEFDGCFYDATLIKCLDMSFAHVRFNHGEEQITATQFILPLSKQVPAPTLQIGDHVLIKTRASTVEPVHYVPGTITDLPNTSKKYPTHYMVTVFDGTIKRALPSILIKIDYDRYQATVEFIRERMRMHDIYKTPGKIQTPPPRLPEKVSKRTQTTLVKKINISTMTVRGIDRWIQVPEDRPILGEVLAKRDEDGWYYKAHLLEKCDNRCCQVRFGDENTVQAPYTELIPIETNKKSHMKVGQKVIAAHPSYDNGYAPATVESLRRKNCQIMFYDGRDGILSRSDIFPISNAQYEDDVMHINRCDFNWEGKTVVARNDKDGQYHLAVCTRRLDSTRCFALLWTDGTEGQQFTAHMFMLDSDKHCFKPGENVLAIKDKCEIIYLPGSIKQINSDGLDIEFCDGSRDKSVDRSTTFYLSPDYYTLTVQFYNELRQ